MSIEVGAKLKGKVCLKVLQILVRSLILVREEKNWFWHLHISEVSQTGFSERHS